MSYERGWQTLKNVGIRIVFCSDADAIEEMGRR